MNNKRGGKLPLLYFNLFTMIKEFKLPIKKAWQVSSKPVETVAPIVTDVSPTSAPQVIGAIWVNTAGPAIWISSGIASVSDWRLIWD
jgi:hypothetical protein